MKYEFQHKRTKKYAEIKITTSGDNESKLARWIEIQLNKHGWYHYATIDTRES